MKLPEFDQLLNLAQTQPEALERLRKHMVDALIAQAQPDVQRRLRGLQFQIDAQRQITKHPLGACVRISNMMTRSFEQMVASLKHPTCPDPISTAQLLTLEPMGQEL